MELCEDLKEWTYQKVYILWDKPKLDVRLRARNGKVGVESSRKSNEHIEAVSTVGIIGRLSIFAITFGALKLDRRKSESVQL